MSETTPFWLQNATAEQPRFIGAPSTRDAIAIQRKADRIGGRGYVVDFAGDGTAEMYWDALVAEARLLQLPDLMDGEWLNSGGYYNRKKGQWFNNKGAKGISIEILRGAVLARILELGLSDEAVNRYITRKGRTVAEEEAFYRMDFAERVEALRTGAAI